MTLSTAKIDRTFTHNLLALLQSYPYVSLLQGNRSVGYLQLSPDRKYVYNTTAERKWFKNNIQDAFAYWIGGLPGVLNPAYMYQESAVDTLGDILEQTTAERRKYSEQQSEQTMTYLIYNSVRRHVTNPYG